MCWDISLHSDIEIVKRAFPKLRDERKQLDMDMYYYENVQAITFPTYPIIYRDKQTGNLALTEMEWGVLPTYIDDPKEQATRRRNQVNIRSERVLGDKRSLWSRLRNQRCLIPVSGTYEHRAIQGWKKKVPYYIAARGRAIFYVPRLYQWHEEVDADGVVAKVGSFALMTRDADALMKNIHNDGPNKHRMPLFLPQQLEQEWLGELTDADMAEILRFEMPETELVDHPVYTLRGYPARPDGGRRYDPFTWDGLPPLGNDDGKAAQASLF